MAKITTHTQLEVYQRAFDTAMRIFRHSKTFPKEETHSLTDQIRRSARSVCTNIAEAWRKGRYEAAFISKLADAEAEAGETQSWLAFAVKCEYMTHEDAKELYQCYHDILRTIVGMINNAEKWILPGRPDPDDS